MGRFLMLMLFNNKIENRHRHSADQQRGYLSKHQRYGQTLKDRVGKDNRGTDDHGKGGEQHGPEADCPSVNHSLGQRFPCRMRSSMKSTRIIEFRTTIPAPAMKPIIEVAVKNAAKPQWAGRIPISEKGMAAITTKGVI